MTGPADDVTARIRAGDQEAFESLFRAHYAALCDFASRYSRDDALAEEIVQDVFSDLWSRRREWHVRDSVRAYLFASVRNRALNLQKRQRVESDWEQEEQRADSSRLNEDRPDVLAERAELRARLDAAMNALPERCRLVMHLRWHEQMTYAEIATIMGISAKGVENQLSRGLTALRQRFA